MSNAIHRVTHRGRRLRWRRLHRRLHEHLDLIAKFASLALIALAGLHAMRRRWRASSAVSAQAVEARV